MASLIFWMLPRSIDLAVIHPWINRIMLVNMLLSGFFLVLVLRGIDMIAKVIFLEMISTMIAAVGITLHNFDLLLCSSFTIPQQQQTGFYMMLAGFGFFMATMAYFFSRAGREGRPAI